MGPIGNSHQQASLRQLKCDCVDKIAKTAAELKAHRSGIEEFREREETFGR